MKNSVLLKGGKEKIFYQRHHWLFSGAIAAFPEKFENGALYPVVSARGELLGHAFFNRNCSLCGRVVSFGKEDPHKAIQENIRRAIALRKSVFHEASTNAYRLINGEGDRLPGLIVDRYGEYLVMQIGTLGMEKIKPFLLETILAAFPVRGIYEKSLLPSRLEEKLPFFEANLWGEEAEKIAIIENGQRFWISYKRGQKTGFFLDQREMRNLVGSHCAGKRVLNCFAYTGGFTVYALKQGALAVDSVDASEEALKMAKENLELNELPQQEFHACDAFAFLREKPLDYDLIILDPPAFAKKKGDVSKAYLGYKEIHRQVFQKAPSGCLLLTCSCSYHFDADLFQKLVFQVANETKREVKILGRHRLGIDHPVNLFHPESEYLKSLFLLIE